jgi:hypothetical protein
MIRERVATHGTVRPLEPEANIPALQLDPANLGIISPRWARVYLAGVQRHEKKYAARMRQIARRRDRAIALLRSQTRDEGGETGGEGWSVVWALNVDADERPPPSSLVVRCDTADALALARAAADTKRKRNTRLATAVSVSGARKNEKGKKVVHRRPGIELWRRLSRGHGAASAAAAATATAQVIVVA